MKDEFDHEANPRMAPTLHTFTYILKSLPPVVIFNQLPHNFKADGLREVMNMRGYVIQAELLASIEYQSPIMERSYYILCTRIASSPISQTLASFSMPSILKTLPFVLADLRRTRQKFPVEAFFVDGDDSAIRVAQKKPKGNPDSWQSIHLEHFQLHGLKWPPDYNSNPELHAAVQETFGQPRVQEAAWYYSCLHAIQGTDVERIVDAEAKMDGNFPDAKTIHAKGLWLVKARRAPSARELLLMNGIDMIYDPEVAVRLVSTAGISVNGIRGNMTGPFHLSPSLSFSFLLTHPHPSHPLYYNRTCICLCSPSSLPGFPWSLPIILLHLFCPSSPLPTLTRSDKFRNHRGELPAPTPLDPGPPARGMMGRGGIMTIRPGSWSGPLVHHLII